MSEDRAGTIRFEVGHDADYLLTAFARYRSAHWSRYVNRTLTALALLLAAYFVVSGLLEDDLQRALVGAVVGVLVLGTQRIARRTLRARLGRGGAQDRYVLILSHEGMLAEGGGSRVMLPWSRFVRAVQFDDGIMLVQGPQAFHWLPFSAAGSATPEAVVAMVSEGTGRLARA